MQVIPEDMSSEHLLALTVLRDISTRLSLPAPRRILEWKAFTREIEAIILSCPVTSTTDVNRLADEITNYIQLASRVAAKPHKKRKLLFTATFLYQNKNLKETKSSESMATYSLF